MSLRLLNVQPTKGIDMKNMKEETLKVWSIRLTPTLIEDIKKAAHKKKQTPSDFVRAVMEKELA